MKAIKVTIDPSGIATVKLISDEEFQVNICYPEFGNHYEYIEGIEEYQEKICEFQISEDGKSLTWPTLNRQNENYKLGLLSVSFTYLYQWSRLIGRELPFNSVALERLLEVEEVSPEIFVNQQFYVFSCIPNEIHEEFTIALFLRGSILLQLTILTIDGIGPPVYSGPEYIELVATEEFLLLEEIKRNKFGEPDHHRVVELQKILKSRITIHSQYELE
ncbi:MAG: hypothetical protein QNL04_01575 [SAR324 cluster bacterium]|nr:hypothetical protein [SAR324 cluster bacterium]